MKRICIVTGSRAEYGLLKPIMKKLVQTKRYDVRIVVTGAHLSPRFGSTYREILDDGFVIDAQIDILQSGDAPSDITKSMAKAMSGFADYFEKKLPDLLIVLGDRYESLAVCCAAMNQRIPIAHLHGGETTQGAIDESIRHCITKMSHLHFTSTREYARRVVQLGEQPKSVHCVGAIGVENILAEELLSKPELEKELGMQLKKPYAVVTFHPVTLEADEKGMQMRELLKAVSTFEDMQFVFTKANADANGIIINDLLDSHAKKHTNAAVFDSLGVKRYLSTLKYAKMVIGNSSSGLLEAPSFGIPTVNIGDRQKGRLKADSVINCAPNAAAIEEAVNKACSSDFLQIARKSTNPYGSGGTSDKVIGHINAFLDKESIDLKKKFYDLEFDN